MLTISLEIAEVEAASHNVTVHVSTCPIGAKPWFRLQFYAFTIEVGESWLFTLPIAEKLEDETELSYDVVLGEAEFILQQDSGSLSLN